MPFVSTQAGKVFYEQQGQGPALVLLHANLHDHHDFDPVAKVLSSSFRTTALDWPGHGQSDTPSPPSRCDAFLLADTLAEVVAALQLPPAVFIGNSVGGYAAARLAINQPNRVAGLVLVNTGGFTKPTTTTQTLCRLLGIPAAGRILQPRLVPRYMKPRNDHDRVMTERARARARTDEGSRVAAALWRSFSRPGYDLRDQASRITAPVLLAWGERDIILPLKTGQQTQRAIPGSRLHTLSTGHVAFASDPEGFLRIVKPFLDSVTTSAQP
jgi:pimeloyl-ACP methyl ester carboxylesterase